MEEAVYIPIPHYPPFTLRSSLIDKDPVIWAHLLEGYIRLCQVLLSDEIKLNVKSLQQLQLFMKVFLYETSEEATRIFSLGAINPDIRHNTIILRSYVLQLIKAYSAVKLGLSGESLWNFVLVYIEKNASTVRGIIDGSFKSALNDNKKSGKILLIHVLRKHLVAQISLGKLTTNHLQYLNMLLGQHTAVKSPNEQKILLSGSKLNHKSKILAKGNKGTLSSALSFAESFVNDEWIETLEKLYAGGKSVHAEVIRNTMVVSILSLSTAKLAKVVSLLGINSASAMALSPLLSAIILSEQYKKVNPGLEERLPFLRKITFKEEESPIDQKDIDFLIEMFPALTPKKASSILRQNDRNVEQVTNQLLEDPDLIDTIPEDSPEDYEISETELQRGIERFKLHENETTEEMTKKPAALTTEDVKKRTLTAALKLLYESDEDERDDTYDDQEHTSGLAFTEFDRKPKNKDKARLVVFDNEKESSPRDDSPAPTQLEIDKTELTLFKYYKTKGEDSFSRTARGTPLRQEMRSATKWSDEQIEGWMRMLSKSPKRFRLLDEQYVFHFSNRNIAPKQPAQQPPSLSPAPSKKANARNEKNKATKANHSRRMGHDKKTRSEMAGMQ